MNVKPAHPVEPCFWCSRKGLPGDQFWLNHRNIWKCLVCFAPESFPPNDIRSVVYGYFTFEQDPTVRMISFLRLKMMRSYEPFTVKDCHNDQTANYLRPTHQGKNREALKGT